jgi:predicted RNase H-like HicB family nuclease
MQFFALIEEWPDGSLIYFRELPGCFSSGPTYEEAVKAAPGAIAGYLNWTKANGIVVLEDFDGSIDVVEKEHSIVQEGEQGPRFVADLPPPNDAEIDLALNVAAAARAAILELYEQVSPEKQNRRLTQESWSLTEHLAHLIESEAWYVSRLQERPAEDFPISGDLEMVFFDRAMDYELFFRDLSPELRQRVFTHLGEEWTAAKALRRMTGHLREHYPWMAAIANALK